MGQQMAAQRGGGEQPHARLQARIGLHGPLQAPGVAALDGEGEAPALLAPILHEEAGAQRGPRLRTLGRRQGVGLSHLETEGRGQPLRRRIRRQMAGRYEHLVGAHAQLAGPPHGGGEQLIRGAGLEGRALGRHMGRVRGRAEGRRGPSGRAGSSACSCWRPTLAGVAHVPTMGRPPLGACAT